MAETLGRVGWKPRWHERSRLSRTRSQAEGDEFVTCIMLMGLAQIGLLNANVHAVRKSVISFAFCLAIFPACLGQTSRNSPPSFLNEPANRVTIIEFGDFECHFCAQQAAALRKLQTEYGNKLVLIFKDFPLPIHPTARAAHEAARAARDQGKFWDMYDLLYSVNGDFSANDFDRFAARLGLDMEKFHRDSLAPATNAAIDKDIAEGKKLRIEGTPTLFVNGRELVGVQSYLTLKRIVEEQLVRKP